MAPKVKKTDNSTKDSSTKEAAKMSRPRIITVKASEVTACDLDMVDMLMNRVTIAEPVHNYYDWSFDGPPADTDVCWYDGVKYEWSSRLQLWWAMSPRFYWSESEGWGSW